MDPKTEVFVAVHGEDFVILACVCLTQYRSVTDGRTDWRLDDGSDARNITCCRA